MMRLGVNIDHVATLRQARKEAYPSPIMAAGYAIRGGADNITCHLREDRRHIQDDDLALLKGSIDRPLNFEMANSSEMLAIALKLNPHSVTLVPEKRQELTTEGGLDVIRLMDSLKPTIEALQSAGILVSLFIESDQKTVTTSADLKVDAVELHTGRLCQGLDAARTNQQKFELLKPFQEAADLAHAKGLMVHLGHGINYQNAPWMQHVNHAQEANIGHAIIAEAVFCGMVQAVQRMKSLINDPVFKP